MRRKTWLESRPGPVVRKSDPHDSGHVSFRNRSSLESSDDDLEELARPPGQGVDAFRLCGPGNERGRDVLAAEGDRPAGERHGVQQSVVVDLAEPGAAVLVLREVAVILDAEAADHVGARL